MFTRVLPSALLLAVSLLLAAAAPTTTGAPADSPIEQLRQRYVARQKELQTRLRALVTHRRLGEIDPTAEEAQELRDLIRIRQEVSRNAAEAKAALDDAMVIVNRGDDVPDVRQAIERDALLRDMRKALVELERGRGPPMDQEWRNRLLSAGRRNLEDITAEFRAKMTARIVESLRQQNDAVARQAEDLDRKVNEAIDRLATTSGRAREIHSLKAQLELLDALLREFPDTTGPRSTPP